MERSMAMKRNILRKWGASALAVCLALSLGGCGADRPGAGETVNLTAEVTAAAPPEGVALAEEQAALLTDFGLRLARHTLGGAENGLISPMSVATALGMTANGARGNTLAEMEAVLGMEQGELNDALRCYWQSLPEAKKVALRPANSVWLTNRQGFAVEPSFLQDCVDFYGAEVFQTPMDQETCREINRWVKEKTDHMIPEILREIPPSAVAYLVNALAFEGAWQEPYEKGQVQEGVFLADGGMPMRTEFLYSEESCYLEHELATGVMKPYQGGRYAFVGLLPKGERSPLALLEELDGRQLQELLRHPREITVQTGIPKFETTWERELGEVLMDMGMEEVFDPNRADLSGLGTAEGGRLYVERVLHKTFLSLDEQGTRAAAVTVVEPATGSPMETETETVYLDQPFVYLLVDRETCVPFFIGVMRDPTGKAPEPLDGAPLRVRIGGVLYESAGVWEKETEETVHCGMMDGEITATTEPWETPTRDDQSNFGTGWGYQFIGDGISVNCGRRWIPFVPSE